MERVLGGPIIGRIPRSRALARAGRGTRALPAPEADAFRTVRVNLRRQLELQGTRSLIVTSAIPGEGKTTLAWNLARIEAAAGSRVLLVEADLRRPSLAKSLEAKGAAGLSELLASDQVQLQDLIQPVDFADGTDPNGGRGGGAVDVLFAGAPPQNPAELLDSERMQAMLEVIPDRYDLVIVDTPPTVVSDAMPILEHVGGVVVVGRVGLSTDESLIGLREQLDRLDAPTLGVVVNGDVPGLVLRRSGAGAASGRSADSDTTDELRPNTLETSRASQHAKNSCRGPRRRWTSSTPHSRRERTSRPASRRAPRWRSSCPARAPSASTRSRRSIARSPVRPRSTDDGATSSSSGTTSPGCSGARSTWRSSTGCTCSSTRFVT